MWSSLATTLVALVHLALCSEGDICFIVGAKSALVNDRLFFIGGNYSVVTQDETLMGPVNSLFSLNVTNTFPVERTIPSGWITKDTIQESIAIAYNNALYGAFAGALWNINDTLYVFGSAPGGPDTVSTYDVTADTWREVHVAGSDLGGYNRSGAVFATAPEAGLGFILGGHGPYINGMIRLDASNSSNLSWTNETLGSGSYGIEVPNLDTSAFVYVPAGKEGILLAFGGENVTSGVNPNTGWPYESDWSIIYIYDIASHTWFEQIATGDVPGYVDTSCYAVTASPDSSAFHITMYGGWSLKYEHCVESVYVLSIPSFTWINITGTSDQTNKEAVNNTIGRMLMSCQLYNGAQMIVLGGDIRSGADSLTHGACSLVYNPMRVLDLSTYRWQTQFNVNITYEVPSVIYDVIGGGATGGATLSVPSGGFASPTLSSILQDRVSTASATSSRSASPSPTGSATTSRHSSNTGAVAGGVVGGIAGLALIIFAAWYFLQRKHRKHRSEKPGASAIGEPCRDIVQPSSAAELEARHLNELHSNARPPQVRGGQVYEL